MSSKYNYEHPMVEQAHSRLAVLDAAQRLAFGVGAQDTRTSGILSVNPALAAMLGRTPSDMRNMLVPELFDETNRRVYLEQMQERTLGRGPTVYRVGPKTLRSTVGDALAWVKGRMEARP